MFSRSLFVLLYFFFWPLCCLFFFDLRNLITFLVSLNSSWELCRVKQQTMKLVFVASLLRTQHQGERAKAGWLGIRIMCACGAKCLSAYCCFFELALWKSKSVCWSRTKQISSSSHWKFTCTRHIKLLNWR